MCGSEEGCTAGTPHSLGAPSPFAGTCVHVIKARAAAESASFSQDLTLALQSYGSLEHLEGWWHWHC